MTVRPFHHQRPLAAAAVLYGLGVWAGVRFSWRPVAYLLGMAACWTAVLLLPRIGRKRVAGCLGVCFFLGALLAGQAAHPETPPAGKYRLTGVLASDTVLRENGTAAAYLENVGAQEGQIPVGKVYWTYTPSSSQPFLPREGERVSFTGKLYLPDGQMNPYGFDFRLFLLQKGAAMGVTGCADGEILDHPGRGLRSLTYAARAWLDERVRLVFGEENALPEALLLGIRENLPEDTAQRFADAGVAHLLAVSGLHVALLTAALMLPLRRFLGHKGRLGVLAAFLFFYCALLDFSAPVMRASLLLLIAQARRIVRRQKDDLTALAAAFLLILLIRPLDLFSASFQLSFGAVLGVAMILPEIRRRTQRFRAKRLWDAVGVTLGGTLGAAVPTIQIYHRISLIGPAINPFACAAFGVLLPVYALTLAVGCVYLPAGVFLASGIRWITALTTESIEALGRLPFASVRVPYIPWYCVLALVLALALGSRYTVWPPRKKAVAALLALAVSFGAWRLTLNKSVQYVQLAVGQEDTALILDENETIVIDAGAYGGDLASYLLATGRQADHLIITHLHGDHCLGIAQLLDKRVPIGRVYLPEGAEEEQVDPDCLSLLEELRKKGVPILHLHAGDTLAARRARGSVLWPEEGKMHPGQDANRYSLTVLWELDGVRVLTTGDLTGAFENYAVRDTDILKVAHHGSAKSTGTDFLRAASPELALITASGHEGASLPHPDVLSRLEEAGIPWYNTGEWGALTVTIRDGEAQLTTHLSHKKEQK